MTEEELRKAFESRRKPLLALGDFVKHNVLLRLEESLGSPTLVDKFLQVPPKPRVKETDSFLEKALVRKPKRDPLNEITDQVGIRFIVLLLEDITIVGNIIETQSRVWKWQKDRDHESERLEKPDYFAYQSDHYVITTIDDIEFEGQRIPVGMSCEIQIRTILQHAYAEMAHACDYKPSIRLMDGDQKKVRRSLAKGSALIETTDDVFREIKSAINEYSRSTDRLLREAMEIYNAITRGSASGSTIVGQLILDQYRNELSVVEPEFLRKWAVGKPWLGEALVQRAKSSIFYRDPIVIIIGYLIGANELEMSERWPLDQSYLEDLFNFLGVSFQGIP